MATHKSALKAHRRASARRLRNRHQRAQLRTAVKKFRAAVASGDTDAAQQLLGPAEVFLHRVEERQAALHVGVHLHLLAAARAVPDVLAHELDVQPVHGEALQQAGREHEHGAGQRVGERTGHAEPDRRRAQASGEKAREPSPPANRSHDVLPGTVTQVRAPANRRDRWQSKIRWQLRL